MRRLAPCLALLAACILPAGNAFAASAKWVHATSPHFDMYAAESESDVKAALQHLEAVRAFFVTATHSQDPNGAPVRIIVFQSSGDFDKYKPEVYGGTVTAYSFDGPPATIVAQGLKPQNYEKIFGEYCQLVMDKAAPKLPFWLRAGLAQFYSTLKPAEASIKMGAPPTRSFHTHGGARTDLAELFAVNRAQYLNSLSKEANDFYSDTSSNAALGARGAAAATALNAVQSNTTVDFQGPAWTLTHMLMFSPDYRGKVGEFIGALSNGQETGAAFNSVYGRSLDQVSLDLDLYMKQSALAVATVKFNAAKPAAPQIKAEPKPEMDATLQSLASLK